MVHLGDGKQSFLGRCSDLSILAVLSLKQHTKNHDGLPLNTEILSNGFPDRGSMPIKLSAGNFEGLGLEPRIPSLKSGKHSAMSPCRGGTPKPAGKFPI